MSASEFESEFLRIFKENKQSRPEREYQILDRLFAEVDAYVGDLPIDDPSSEIDEDQLRQEARAALEALEALN
ncbi:MAG TPA: colicin immunity domain-containing protein [Dehalococcoidia bacterium]|nr:colicin immunity domain-containing protein [Dehalococcoidia bacterium]